MTLSPTPACAWSIATKLAPTSSPCSSSGCTTNSVRPANAGCLTAAHIGPTTRQHLIAHSDVDAVDDADDRGVDRHEPRIERERGLARADQVDEVAVAGLHGIDRGLEVADGLAVLVDRLDEQDLLALEAGGLALGDDRALDDAQVHRARTIHAGRRTMQA